MNDWCSLSHRCMGHNLQWLLPYRILGRKGKTGEKIPAGFPEAGSVAAEASFGHLWNPQGELSSTGLSSFDSSSTTYPRPALPTEIYYKPHIQVTLIAGTLNSKKKGQGLPWWLSGKESACLCRIHGLDPWSGKIPPAAEQLSPRVTNTEPALYSSGATTTEHTGCNYCSPCTREPVLCNRRSPPGRSSSTATGEQAPLSTTRESPCSNKASAQPKINTQT